MSGNSGIRGYYYQILATLLESIENAKWESVRIEPSTKNDKVDIEWIFEKEINVVQVKSSMNNFKKSDLINWVITLVKDAKKSYEFFDVPITYTLYLIGSTEPNSDKWISDLHGNRLDIKDTKLDAIKNELSKIKVKKQNFDFASLEALSYVRMQEYLRRQGKEAKLESVKTLCDVITNELFKFSLQGKAMTKAMFLNLIGIHIKNKEYEISSLSKISSELSLAFYKKGLIEETNEMFKFNLSPSPLLQKLLSKAREFLNDAKSIKLPLNAIDDEEEYDLLSLLFLHGNYTQLQVSDKDIAEIKKLSKSFLNIELDDEDFNFGKSKKRITDVSVFFNGQRNIDKGKDKAIDKYFAIKGAQTCLSMYGNLKEYTNYLDTCYPLPIILVNNGEIADEEIIVILKFPENVKVVTPNSFRIPPEIFLKEFIENNEYFNNLFSFSKDFGVMDHKGIKRRLPIRIFDKVQYNSKDFEVHLDYLFDYEYFDENGRSVLKYDFKSLNPGHKMAFPTFILIQTDLKTVDITYTIRSKYLSIPIEGTLTWKNKNP